MPVTNKAAPVVTSPVKFDVVETFINPVTVVLPAAKVLPTVAPCVVEMAPVNAPVLASILNLFVDVPKTAPDVLDVGTILEDVVIAPDVLIVLALSFHLFVVLPNGTVLPLGMNPIVELPTGASTNKCSVPELSPIVVLPSNVVSADTDNVVIEATFNDSALLLDSAVVPCTVKSPIIVTLLLNEVFGAAVIPVSVIYNSPLTRLAVPPVCTIAEVKVPCAKSPCTVKFSPIVTDFLIPAPPEVVNDPVVLDVLLAVLSISILPSTPK